MLSPAIKFPHNAIPVNLYMLAAVTYITFSSYAYRKVFENIWLTFQSQDHESDGEEEGVLQPLLELQKTADEKQAQSRIQLFSHSKFIANETEDANEEGDTEEITDG